MNPKTKTLPPAWAWIRRALTRNWGTKLITLGFAFFIWIYVLSATNPTRTQTFQNLPIDIKAESMAAVQDNGLMLAQELTTEARVRVSIPYNDVLLLKKSSIRVYADVSGIQSEGHHTVPLLADVPVGVAVDIYPETVTVETERAAQRRFTLDIVPESQLTVPGTTAPAGAPTPTGLYVLQNTPSPAQVVVTGPLRVVNTVARAVIAVPDPMEAGTLSGNYPVLLLDETGAPMVDKTLQTDAHQGVTLTREVYPTKTVPLAPAVEAVAGSLPEGYIMDNLSIKGNAAVRVAAPQEVLDSLSVLAVDPIDLSDKTESFETETALKLPEGVIYAEHWTVPVSATISARMEEATFEGYRVYRRSAGRDTALSGQSASLTVSGPAAVITAVKNAGSPFRLYVDTTDLAPGTHTLPIRLEWTENAPQGVDALKVTLMPAQVEVVVS